MKRKFLIISMVVVCLAAFSSFTFNSSNAEKGHWVKLGSKKVNFKVDKDVIKDGVNGYLANNKR